MNILGVLFIFVMFSPLLLVLTNKTNSFDIKTFFLLSIPPILFSYIPFPKLEMIGIFLAGVFIIVFSYLLSKIKIEQYQAGLLGSSKIWISNILISLWAAELPLLSSLWLGFFEGEKNSSPGIIMLMVSIPASLLFFIYFAVRISTGVVVVKANSEENPVTSQSPLQSP